MKVTPYDLMIDVADLRELGKTLPLMQRTRYNSMLNEAVAKLRERIDQMLKIGFPSEKILREIQSEKAQLKLTATRHIEDLSKYQTLRAEGDQSLALLSKKVSSLNFEQLQKHHEKPQSSGNVLADIAADLGIGMTGHNMKHKYGSTRANFCETVAGACKAPEDENPWRDGLFILGFIWLWLKR